MYLKSLELKGFKSFADRSVLALEPGITAVVGPNGSGKSNISDAVLWVLGERSARNLRGQAMEDIIFSGSAARKAVSVAEVDLVLDNSDGTLPVEFDEVTITRRMYRSGESEYLVNGVVSRRLDVLDILHDTGLGTGTHSIISQGSLDSILQSKPEDRRALIEEAAGILKHKQRKEKSARKLQAMDNHLQRVQDVAAEVSRQLGPLERKAKRAEAYKEASARLAELRLAVAVDDLRALQVQWAQICEAEKQLAEEVDSRRTSVQTAEQQVNDIQELIKRESEDAGELTRKHSRAASLGERLDSAEMLVRERRRAAVGYEADMQSSLEGSAARREEAQRELATAQEQLATSVAALEEADSRQKALDERAQAASTEHAELNEQATKTSRDMRTCEQEADKANRELNLLRESLSNGLAHMKLVEARKQELQTDLSRAQREHDEASKAAREAREALEQLRVREKESQEALLVKFEQREQARKNYEEVREQRALADSEVKAIEQSLKTTRESHPALAWLVDNAEKFGGFQSISRVLKVAGAYEGLVESLLGEDLAALAMRDVQQANEVAAALFEGAHEGDVSLVLNCEGNAAKIQPARASKAGTALIDNLSYPDSMAPAVQALLGDVVVCKTRSDAFKAQEADNDGLRFASLDGCAIWPNGKVRVFGRTEDDSQGVLARERRLDEAKERRGMADESLAKASEEVARAEEAYRDAQAASLKLSEELANQKGASSAADTEEQRAASKLTSVVKESEDIEKQMQTATQTVDEIRPNVEACEKQIADLSKQRSQLTQLRDELAAKIQPAQERLQQARTELSEAKLARATHAERKEYAQRMVTARQRDLQTLEESDADAKRSIAIKRVAVERGEELLNVFSTLAENLQRRIRLLDEAVNASHDSTSSIHAQAASARDAARAAHDAYDATSQRIAQVRIEKSRLEVQVQAAVEQVVVTCATPIEVAEQLPQLEERQQVEDEVFRLERRIRNMGTINPDAAEEYAALKERYDFLAGQLEDMDAARRSLSRIVRVIDARMKDDFVTTFAQVNQNFNEVFGVLFPGGTAHLSLVDPDDVENSGVEVTAQPRGKRLTKMMLMSGGEKSLTALALLFAVYKTRTTPFYILDEVEAALDDTNLRRLTSYIDTLRETTQLIMITHQRRTMEMADVLFGVSMQADGVTKVISQKLERALEQAE